MNATTSDRIPQRQFRGTWAHVDLFDFIESGELSPRAAWLAMIIDSFCKGKKGCFAGNDHLATRLNVKERQIQNLLAELEKVGILKTKFVGKLRYLRIDWSQDSKETRKSAYKTDGRHAKNCVSDTQKIASIGEVPNGTSKKEEENRPASPDRLPPNKSPSSANIEPTKCGHSEASPSGNRMKGMFYEGKMPVYGNNCSPDCCYKWADWLKRIVERTSRRTLKGYSAAGWAKLFDGIWKRFNKDSARIDAALQLLSRNNGQDGWPMVTHPIQFERQIDWIEGMQKKENKVKEERLW